MQEPSWFKPDELVLHRYRVRRLVASGAMGELYRVEDVPARKVRALKAMKSIWVRDREARSRFLREIEALQKVDNEYVVQLLDWGISEPQGVPCLITEFLSGEDLEQRLSKAGAFEPSCVVALLNQAACALDAIHAAGIVHRDLKPSNLFLKRRQDGSEDLKVLDFGVAKLLDASNAARTTLPLGTPLYMAPEQLTGDAVDCRTDIYALGQIAYTLLAGEPHRRRARSGKSTAASSLELPSSFDAWFARATATEKCDRYATASQAVMELASALSVDLPRPSGLSLLPRTTSISPAQHRVRARPRSRVIVTIAASVVALACIGYWMMRPHPTVAEKTRFARSAGAQAEPLPLSSFSRGSEPELPQLQVQTFTSAVPLRSSSPAVAHKEAPKRTISTSPVASSAPKSREGMEKF